MADNQINDSLQVNTGRRIDYRENAWPSVAAAEAAITGSQRIAGQFIPVIQPNGIAFPHHWVNNALIPFDGKINQSDALIYAGFTLKADETAGTINGSSWRVSDFTFVLPVPVEYPIDAVAPGLFRADYIIGTPTGATYYEKGEAGGTYVPPVLPYKHILIQEIRVSEAAVVNVEPEIPVSDGEMLYGSGTPASSLGKLGDVYKNNQPGLDFGKEYKKRLVAGVADWVLEYTPAAGGGASTFAGLTDAPGDNPLLAAALSDLAADIETAQETANLAQDGVDALELGKVDKVAGKSLLSDTEIARLLTLSNIEAYSFASSTEDTDLTAGIAKISFRMPYAFTVTLVKASLNVAAAGSNFITNIKVNGVTMFSTNLSIDAGELTSVTAAVPAVISNPVIPNDALVTVDIVQVGGSTAGKGLKFSFIGYKS